MNKSKAHRVSAYLEFELVDAAYSSLCEVHRRLSEATQPFVAIKAVQSLDLSGVKWRTPKGEPYFRNGEVPKLWAGRSIRWLEFDKQEWKRCRKEWMPILLAYRLKREQEVIAAFNRLVEQQVDSDALRKELGTQTRRGPVPSDYSNLKTYVAAVRSDIANGLPLNETLKVRSKQHGFDANNWRIDTAKLRGYLSRESKRMG